MVKGRIKKITILKARGVPDQVRVEQDKTRPAQPAKSTARLPRESTRITSKVPRLV